MDGVKQKPKIKKTKFISVRVDADSKKKLKKYNIDYAFHIRRLIDDLILESEVFHEKQSG